MKILHINTYDIDGGAARAAYRLHNALLAQGVDSKMLVQRKGGDDYTVIAPTSKIKKAINLLRPTLDRLPLLFYKKNKKESLFSPSLLPFSDVVKKIEQINPDIVHLHWICGGMLPVTDLAKIKQPIVWSLHDMWAMTDGDHLYCTKYEDSKFYFDFKYWLYKRKQTTYKKIDTMYIVGLSKWISNHASQSKLLKDKKHINLPNPIDTNIYKPIGKQQARELLNIPKDKKLILFGAMGATSDKNKGFDLLSDALNQLAVSDDIEFIVFGNSEPQSKPNFKFKTRYIGRLHDDISLVVLYSAADVMIVPSRQENLSNAIMESLSCATPVVSFDVGGNEDMIEHKINGYLAKPFDTSDLKDGIEWILNSSNYDELCENARRKVMNSFDSRLVSKKYIELYETVLNE